MQKNDAIILLFLEIIREIKLAIILATRWQLMMLEVWQNLLQLEEEAFAGFVAVGIHVEGDREL